MNDKFDMLFSVCAVFGCWILWRHLVNHLLNLFLEQPISAKERTEEDNREKVEPDKVAASTEIFYDPILPIIEPHLEPNLESPNLDCSLKDYYIKSSHNSYINGNQLVGESSVDAVLGLLLKNVRCVELDLHDGPDGPTITHKWTLMTSISAIDVFEAIKKNLKPGDLPIIVDVEDHLSDFQRCFLIKKIHKIFKDILYVEERGVSLPSPNELRGRVIIMANENWKPLSDLCKKVPYEDVTRFKTRQLNEVSSLSEHQFQKMLKPSPDILISATKIRLIRAYPGGERQLSGNFNPVPALNTGIQLVALNHQTKDENLELLNCVFRENGDTGFALKPEILRTGTQSVPGKRISIEIIEENIPKKHSVNLKVFDGLKKVTTTTLKKGKKTELQVHTPELAYMIFKLKKKKFFGLKNDTKACYAIPITKLLEGEKELELSYATLKINVKIENLE